MSTIPAGPVAYIMKRYPRLTETFILNEIRAMERLGAQLHIVSLLPPEPPPHHPMVAEVKAPILAVPMAEVGQGAWVALAQAHGRALVAAPWRYLGALACAAWWSIQSPSPRSVWKQFTRAGFVAAFCRRAGIRHIHAHFANAPAAVARFTSLMSGIPYSFTAHAKDLYLTPKRVIQRRARAASFVATCTGYNAHYLRDLLGPGQANKINLVYHGIDLTHFARRAEEPIQTTPLILSVGRLVPKKGHDDLIEACAKLRDVGHQFRCMIVGAGPLRDTLTSLIAKHDLQTLVTLEGAMTHASLIDLYRQANIFALAPCIAEDGDRDGIPNVIAEAMAIGVPVVSTDVSGIPEVVRDGETGLLVPPRDPSALADAIGRLLDNPAYAVNLASAARILLETDFDLWSTTATLHGLMGCAGCSPLANTTPERQYAQ